MCIGLPVTAFGILKVYVDEKNKSTPVSLYSKSPPCNMYPTVLDSKSTHFIEYIKEAFGFLRRNYPLFFPKHFCICCDL